MFDIVCIGDSTLDLFFFIKDASVHCDINSQDCELTLKYASKIPVEKFAKSLGGNAANVSVGLSRLGLKTALVTVFGNDDDGAFVKRKLLEENVDLSHSVIPESRHSNTSSIIVYKGERTILTYHDESAKEIVSIPQGNWFYLTNVFFDINLIPAGAKIAFNPGVREIKKGPEFLKTILDKTEILFVNRDEYDQVGPTNVKTVVVTDGANGVTVFQNDQEFKKPAVAATILETTGAGDAFASGFLAAIFYGKTVEEAMEWGLKNSASVISKIGGTTGLLNKNEIS